MIKKQRVIVYGNSVVLSGISASIDLDPDCEVIGYSMTADLQDLYVLHPNVVIFDLDAVQPDFIYRLAQDIPRLPGQPPLLLIGIDPETNRAVVWSGWEAKELSSQDLAQVIHQMNSSNPNLGGSNEKKALSSQE